MSETHNILKYIVNPEDDEWVSFPRM
jgi:hypothetical protein